MQKNLKVFSRVALILAVLILMVCPTAVGQTAVFTCKTVVSIPVEECEALVALYVSTNGPGWTTSTYWLDSPPEKWYGVTVTDGHVESLVLSTNNLIGTIPTNLVLLTNLKILSLYQNHLSGSIPHNLGSLTNLQTLDLGANELTGGIPVELGNLSNLQMLYLPNNNLSGVIPSSLGNLIHLTELSLLRNQLSGSIPLSFQYLTQLQFVYLSENQLTGQIPSTLGNLIHLEDLYLFKNQLTGPIPESFGALTSLKTLVLQSNQLTGGIPSALGLLTNLIVLTLRDNQLSGPIPASLINLENLNYLDLDYNQLTVPSDYPNPTNELHALLVEKNPNWYLTQSVEKSIPSSGGVLASRDGRITLTVPENAVPANTILSFIPHYLSRHPVDEMTATLDNFQILAGDGLGNPITSLSRPIILTIFYGDGLVGDPREGSLRVYYWDIAQEKWLDVATTCPDGAYTRVPTADVLTVPICHLSDFILAVPTERTVFLPLTVR